jgi:hypothetical protein
MTPALKAMVEAMAAELVRQDGSDRGQANCANVDNLNEAMIDGWYDLEKVARAGLEAINRTRESEADAIRALQGRYLNTMSGEEAERLNGEIQRRGAALSQYPTLDAIPKADTAATRA